MVWEAKTYISQNIRMPSWQMQITSFIIKIINILDHIVVGIGPKVGGSSLPYWVALPNIGLVTGAREQWFPIHYFHSITLAVSYFHRSWVLLCETGCLVTCEGSYMCNCVDSCYTPSWHSVPYGKVGLHICVTIWNVLEELVTLLEAFVSTCKGLPPLF